jgi:hypothetical protein
MRRLLGWGTAIVVPAVALAILVGCGGGAKTDDEEEDGGKRPKASQSGKGGPTVAALEASYNGTLTGKVTIEGRPDVAKLTRDLQELMKAKDEAHCLAASASPLEKEQQGWRIDENGGLGNVFVWLVPPRGKFFKVDMAKKTWEEKVIIDQPHCAFKPHAVVVFPKYRDDKGKMAPTGQVFEVVNSADFNHNTNVDGGVNSIMAANAKLPVELEPGTKPVEIKCNIHTWMNAFALALDHPYAALTKPDGTYEIKNVPTGVEVQIIAWHEKAGYLNADLGKGQKETLKEKEVLDFKAKAP